MSAVSRTADQNKDIYFMFSEMKKCSYTLPRAWADILLVNGENVGIAMRWPARCEY